MSNKSGTSSQVISLPKGGGALSGIGETFSPDLHTGTGNFTIPIALPPGRNGFQPDLKLVYSTGSGNGPFGLGWGLSIPGISRKTAQGVPRYDVARDVFILSGAEDLVQVNQESNIASYRPRTEGLFARIEHHHDEENGQDYWQVFSKDGLISWYGTPRPDGADEHWQDPAVITDPTYPSRIFTWKLIETQDPFGNRIIYEYERDLGQSSEEPPQHHWDQLYLKRIRYVDYDDNEFLVSVTFDYGSDLLTERLDPSSDYRAGFEIRTRWRCRQIQIRIHAAEVCADIEEGCLARTYDLVYLDQREDLPDLAQLLPPNGVSLLSQIMVTGHDGDQIETLPPLEFGYTRFDPTRRDFFPVEGRDIPARSLANPNLELADLFGNGLPDILEMNGTVRYWRNLGNGRFDLPRPMRDAPAGLTLADPNVQLLDADGDGRIDLLATSNGLSGYFPLQFNGEWDRRSFRRYRQAPSFSLADPEVKLVDLDGDGVTDAIRSGSRMECFINDPHEGWNGTRFLPRDRDLAVFPNINFSDPRVKWGDMSGDGLQDILLVHDGNIEYWPNLGRGDWGPRVHMRHSPRYPYGYDPRRVLIGDVDGDGLADLVYVDNQQVFLYLNQSGNGWSEAMVIDGTPPVTNMDAVRLVDFMGTGISGVLWSWDVSAPGRESMFYLDFTGGAKPYLLNEMDNNMGAVTKVAYISSTRFYLTDQQRPETRWQTPLPFPVQVVTRVEIIDDISKGKLTTEYRYHHGYWDGAEREFRGFGLVEQVDTETFAEYAGEGLHSGVAFADVAESHFSPPLLTKTWFHQGPVGEEFGEWAEVDYGHEFWEEDPPLLGHRENIQEFLASFPMSPESRRVKRDALRTLRGRILRAELYALDGSVRQERPYTVSEYSYGLIEKSLSEDEDTERQHIFFPHLTAQRTSQWERGEDPLTQFTFIDDYDEYGQPRTQTSAAPPRRSARREPITVAVAGSLSGDEVNETRILVGHIYTEFAMPDPGLYMYDRVAQVRAFELESPPEVVESNPADLSQVLQDQTAAAVTVHQRFRALLEGWSGGTSLPAELRLTGHTLNHYDGPAFEGRAPGEVGPYGALTRSEALVFTEHELDEAYGERRPVYLGGSAALPPGAPAGFGDDLGYRLQADSPPGYHHGYYADTQRTGFDVQDPDVTQQRGMVTGLEDVFHHRTTIAIDDPYWLLPVQVTDPVGLATRARYDYRLFQPRSVTDPNGNATHIEYTPLGLLHRQFLEGNHGEGGTADRPEVTFRYDFEAYLRTRDTADPQPIYVHTGHRLYHASQGISDEIIEAREYSDGFGRLIQSRAQAEELAFGESGDDVGLPRSPGSLPGPAVGHRIADRVVVSGWTTYDNKGRPVEQYEPFFDQGWDYLSRAEAEQQREAGGRDRFGQKATLYYDPRGQLIRTLNPDGSEQWVIYGVLRDLNDPDDFASTPWEAYTYDANDNAGRTHSDRANAYEHHWNTPNSILIDALGRTLLAVERDRVPRVSSADPLPSVEAYLTRSRFDLRGNLLTVTDALGRPAFRYAYDLLNNPLQVDSIDAGLRTSALDAAGNLVEYRDSKGSVVLREYDHLNRLTKLWARNDDMSDRLTLRERLEYGDDGNPSQPAAERDANRALNRLGRMTSHYDEAGLLHFEGYDFKGNLLTKTRQVIGDAAIAAGWVADWDAAGAGDDLDPTLYRTDIDYDALNRPLAMTYPADVDGHRAVLTPHYNRAGALERIEQDGQPYVTQLAYNAKGQRALITYGNGLLTRYAYDPLTFRLARLRTERYAASLPVDTLSGLGTPLQDFSYQYDLVGNILTIEERTPNCGIVGTLDGRHRLLRRFEYDPLYRLTYATGRACKDIGIPRSLADLARCGAYTAPYSGGPPVPNQTNAPELTEHYFETYRYDPLGNILALRYWTPGDGWTRAFGLAVANNRLASLEQGGLTHHFDYDDNGNMTRQNSERRYGWDQADRMIHFTNQPVGSSLASIEARYLYGADGLRVKKWVRTNGSGEGETRVYIDAFFEHYRWREGGQSKENNLLHVMDNQQRVALVRQGSAHPQDAGPPIHYHLGDHLGSSSLVVDDGGGWVNREEYFPYGETSLGSFARKRYRFSGKERDEESGLYYHDMRYYKPYLMKWGNCDPAGMVDGVNLFTYVGNNPMCYRDQHGMQMRRQDNRPVEETQELAVPETHERFEQEVLDWIHRRVKSRSPENPEDPESPPARRERVLVIGNPSLQEVWHQVQGQQGRQIQVRAEFNWGLNRVESIRFSTPERIQDSEEDLLPIQLPIPEEPSSQQLEKLEHYRREMEYREQEFESISQSAAMAGSRRYTPNEETQLMMTAIEISEHLGNPPGPGEMGIETGIKLRVIRELEQMADQARTQMEISREKFESYQASIGLWAEAFIPIPE